MTKHIYAIIFLLFGSIPAIFPLVSPEYFSMHDDTQIERVIVMGRALRNGQFPVRWVSDLGYGYGYPIFNFYGPLPYYIGGSLYMVGVPAVVATKIMMIVGFLLVGITMYVLVATIVGSTAGVFSGLLSVYAPYHAVQLYVRGAIGEVWVVAFIPVVLLGIYSICMQKRRKVGIGIGIIGLAGVILCHTIFGFTTVFFLAGFLLIGFFYLLTVRNRWKDFLSVLAILLFGLSGTAFFWLPAIVEMGYTSVSGQIGPTASVMDHFVCVSQLYYSPWGFGGSVPGCVDGLSFALGKLYIVFTLLGLAGLFKSWRNISVRFMGITGFGLFIISVFFMIKQSQLLWDLLPGFLYVQYPWRFLVYTNVAISMLAATIPTFFRSRVSRIVFCFVGTSILIGLTAKLFTVQNSFIPSASIIESEDNLRFRASKISDEYLPIDIIRPKNSKEYIRDLIPPQETYVVKTVIDKETYKKAEFLSKKESKIILNHAYFPGWEIWVNDIKQSTILDQGRPVIIVPSGFSTLQMWFKDTMPRIIGNFISLITVVLLGYIYGKKNFR